MDYIGLLTKIVKESGLTHAEITRCCEESCNVVFDDNYISTIKHRGSPPSEEISRAIAKACGRHEDLLVIQGYYDKAPQAFKHMFDSIIGIVKAIDLMILSQNLGKTTTAIAKQRLDEMAFGEWLEHDLSGLSEKIRDTFSKIMDFDEFAETMTALVFGEVENVCSYIMPDDSLSPTIPEGAQVHTMLVDLGVLKDGDFICHSKDTDNDEFCIRQIEFLGKSKGQMLLKAMNGKGTKSEVIDTSSERLYEKVVQIVIDFE